MTGDRRRGNTLQVLTSAPNPAQPLLVRRSPLVTFWGRTKAEPAKARSSSYPPHRYQISLVRFRVVKWDFSGVWDGYG